LGLLFHRCVAYNLKKLNFELVETNSFVLFPLEIFNFSCNKAGEVVSYSQNQITYQQFSAPFASNKIELWNGNTLMIIIAADNQIPVFFGILQPG
jgi:hypothetical protein